MNPATPQAPHAIVAMRVAHMAQCMSYERRIETLRAALVHTLTLDGPARLAFVGQTLKDTTP